MKFLTHTYTIVLFEDGKFCWKNKGWVKTDGKSYCSRVNWKELLCWHQWKFVMYRQGVGKEYFCERCFKCKIEKVKK